jgi:hypothetical protein
MIHSDELRRTAAYASLIGALRTSGFAVYPPDSDSGCRAVQVMPALRLMRLKYN